jgi:hypothetical protein
MFGVQVLYNVLQGPKDGLVAVDVDMDSSDTFLTAAAIAAVAKGTTKIRNIANQRVKVLLAKKTFICTNLRHRNVIALL